MQRWAEHRDGSCRRGSVPGLPGLTPVALLALGMVMLAGCAGTDGPDHGELYGDSQPSRTPHVPALGQDEREPGREPDERRAIPEVASVFRPVEAMLLSVVADADLEATSRDAGSDDERDVDEQAIESLRGDDRAHWEPVAFEVPLGQIAHRPIYISTPPVSDELLQVRSGPVPWRMEAAMTRSGERQMVMDVLLLPVEAGWFSFETALLPAKLLVHPPLNRDLTPPGDAPRLW